VGARNSSVGARSRASILSSITLERGRQEALKGRTGVIEFGLSDQVSPVLLDLGDPVAGILQRLPPAGRRKDELGSAVGGIWLSLEVAEVLQVGDQVRGSGQAQLRPAGEFGQPDAVNADVAEYLQMRFSRVAVTTLGCTREQLDPELSQQPYEQLADG
jgi:hypothetical protein